MLYTLAVIVARFTRSQRLALIFILLAAFGLRLHQLGADSLWYDETVSAMLAAKPLAMMWAHTAGDIHPPLYYALLHGWILAAGNTEWALAFLSLWFGMGSVALVAHLGLRTYGAWVGLLAAALAAINPFALWYAQEVRMYTLGGFLLLAALIVTWRILVQPDHANWRSYAVYALLAALSLWTLYFSAFALIALNLFALPWLWLRARRSLWPWLLAQLAAIVLFLPWLPIALRQALDPPVPPWRETIATLDLLVQAGRESTTALAFGQSLNPSAWWPLGFVIVGVALCAFGLRDRLGERVRWGTLLLWLSIAGPLVLILVISQALSPLWHVRYLNLYAGAYPVLLAAGLLFAAGGRALRFDSRWRAALAIVLAIVMVAGTGVSYRNYFQHRFDYESADDLRGAVGIIAANLGPDDAILVNAGYLYPALLYYWPGKIGWLGRLNDWSGDENRASNGPAVVLTGHVNGDPDIGWGDPESDFFAMSEQETAAKLGELFQNFNTIWLLRGYDTVNDPDGFIRNWLDEHGDNYFDQVFPGQSFVRAQAWRTGSAAARASELGTTERIDFDNIRWLGVDISPNSPQSGQPLRLTHYWQATGPIDRGYKVFNQLLDANDTVVAQKDGLPNLGAFPTDRWSPGQIMETTFVLALPPDLPSGEYRLVSGWYDENTGERLPRQDGGDSVSIPIQIP
ncbi:MAG: glycosyltransferase family 39 protein [Caldilineales bacterium]|nr:glycosyltransferase family 39 protein [Caldilineales bacterium]